MRSLVVGTAGHIDHGKSTLVQALTGTDPDRLQEEKARGITIDLGFAHCREGDITIAFVDVPGHERFVRNMLAGAGGLDGVMLVVAADESVMPQTREHFEICRLLQVPAGVVALTKADLVDAEMLDLVRLEVRELVAGSALADAPVLSVSARTGAGLAELRAALVALAARAPSRPSGGPARLPVDRAFSMKGFGTVVTGTLVSGTIGEEEELTVLPAGRTVKVRGVQVHGERRARAGAGERTAVNLGGIELGDIVRGDTLAAPGAFEPTRRLDAAIELLPHARPLKHGARVRFHQGTSEIIGRVALAGARDQLAGAPGGPAPDEMLPGSRAFVRLRLERPAVVTRGDRCILRAYSPPVTIAGGEILDPHPSRGPLRTPAGRTRLLRLDGGPPAAGGSDAARRELEAVRVMIEERGAAGLPVAALVARAGARPDLVGALVERLAAAGAGRRIADVLVAPARLDALAARLVDGLGDYHRAQPLSEGMPREEARERFFGRAHAAVFDVVVAELVAQRRIVARDRLALAAHRISLSPEEQRARDAIERIYRDSALKPPDPGELVSLVGGAPDLVERMVRLLVRQKTLVKLDALVFHAAALDRLKADVAALKAQAAADVRVDVPAFKERYGISRKFAIPLLEYLDRERVTRRKGEVRVVL